jgi:hypothetical protein
MALNRLNRWQSRWSTNFTCTIRITAHLWHFSLHSFCLSSSPVSSLSSGKSTPYNSSTSTPWLSHNWTCIISRGQCIALEEEIRVILRREWEIRWLSATCSSSCRFSNSNKAEICSAILRWSCALFVFCSSSKERKRELLLAVIDTTENVLIIGGKTTCLVLFAGKAWISVWRWVIFTHSTSETIWEIGDITYLIPANLLATTIKYHT